VSQIDLFNTLKMPIEFTFVSITFCRLGNIIWQKAADGGAKLTRKAAFDCRPRVLPLCESYWWQIISDPLDSPAHFLGLKTVNGPEIGLLKWSAPKSFSIKELKVIVEARNAAFICSMQWNVFLLRSNFIDKRESRTNCGLVSS
jgi:hypothetical protein